MPVMNIDLHIHSTFSDGAYSPSDLVKLAIRNGVNVVALADHDTVSGIPDAVSAGLAQGVEVIPAIEISVQFESFRDVHLLGYGLDFNNSGFLARIAEFQAHREQRNHQIVELVNRQLEIENKPAINIKDVLAYARDTIGRPHIARVLLDKRYVSSIEEAFQQYLVPCNVPKQYWLMDDAIMEIHRIGGIAVLAHPTSICKDLTELRRIITDLKYMGLDGIEVFNNMGWPQEIEFLRRLAEELDLLITAGSDFHGIESGIEIGKGREGIRFDSSLLAPLVSAINKQRISNTTLQL
jgi:3',5'-nucleoside bisphosphate phosphatase